METPCSACGSTDTYPLYEIERIPVFLNKHYPNREAARSSPAAAINLRGCCRCGLVFNAQFESAKMDYNEDYVQSQGHAASFQRYTLDVLDLLLQDIDTRRDKIVEIGCGKEAYFLNMLLDRGVDIVGFDPVYRGGNARITPTFFDRAAADKIQARAVVIRHTLDHIAKPLDFLQDLKTNLPADTLVFIESPRWEWILEKKAFWGISYEICSYFSQNFFLRVFSGKAVMHRTFSNQYMIVKARLGDLISTFLEKDDAERYPKALDTDIASYRQKIKSHARNYVWGAGAKGNIFANILDPQAKYIQAVIDINSEKQGRFLPLTAHPCLAPEQIPWETLGEETCLWIMNENYKKEILARIPEFTKGRVVVLGEPFPSQKAA